MSPNFPHIIISYVHFKPEINFYTNSLIGFDALIVLFLGYGDLSKCTDI